ncbi:folate family ECF transporter S component [Vagococcus acidifermentans]|uniref:folate family ECF transporter S component n=1 Tax=Vagococcus acidifermentans TaxID=564710 RepID=UPI00147765D3|nr:folate family ECF transporter S component [Vagococcus acidifermentans]
MNRNYFTARTIATMGLLMALQMILTRFLAIQLPFLRISFSFIPTVMMGLLFGPLLAGVGTTLADFIGITLFPVTGSYFPGFSVSAFLTGAIYGLFFHKRDISWRSAFISNLLIMVIIDIILNTLWLYLMMGPVAIANLPLRIGKALLQFPVNVFLTYHTCRTLLYQRGSLRIL